jgi:predicted nucleotidyltransferase
MKLTKTQQIQINKIGKKYDLKFIIIHGSYATGTAHKGSDLDIAVLSKKKIDFDTLLKIHTDLASILGDNEERELDLKSLHQTSIAFRYYATRDSVLIYGNQTEFHNFQAYAYRAYIDNKSFFNLQDKLIRLRLNHLKKQYA